MFRGLLGEWGVGRLDQRQFAMLYVVVVGAMFVWAFLVFALAAVAVTLFNADSSMRGMGGYGVALIASFFLLLAAFFNVVVKRGRDAGIPGFITGVCFLLLFAFGGLPIFATILLALVPTGSFASYRQ